MQERHLYEYAVIRFVPKVEREEFINMGIVLFSKQAKYLKSLYTRGGCSEGAEGLFQEKGV